MLRSLLFTIVALFMLAPVTKAQTQAPYTNGNTILVVVEGIAQNYTYTSKELLVRYNRNTKNMECILNVASLLPTNDTIPPSLAQDIFFVSKFPEYILEFAVPDEQVTARNLRAQTANSRASITFQGITNETLIPVAFNSDKQALMFGTSYDFMLDNFEASIPLKYAPLITGRIRISIQNARWASLTPN